MKAETFRVLEQAGLPSKHAHAIAHALEIECAAGHAGLARKVDIADLRAELLGMLHAVKGELVRWLFLVVLGQTAVLAAGGYFYINFYVNSLMR